MEIFDQKNLSTTPMWIRWIIFTLILVACIAAAMASAHYSLVGNRDALAVGLIEIFKVLALALAIWFFFLVGQKARSRKDLLAKISVVLTEELPSSIVAYSTHLPDYHEFYPFKRGVGQIGSSDLVRMGISHIPGSTQARYRIEWFGKTLLMYVQLNVRRMSIVYYLPESLHPRFEQVFAACFTGARSAGWQMEDYGIHASDHAYSAGRHAEIAALRDLGEDFIHDSAARLFITNDVAAMSRNIAIAWSRSEPAPARPVPSTATDD